MDTSTLEHTAEDLISHKLQRYDLLVAKPKCDRLGTDLLVFAEMADGVKFCRIQAKGRSLVNSENSNIKIPKKYVTNGFIVFLYLEFSKDIQELYLFLPSDIRQWSISTKNEYQLSLSRSNAETKLEINRFEPSKIKLIKSIIQDAEVHGEFRQLIFGNANLEASTSISISVT